MRQQVRGMNMKFKVKQTFVRESTVELRSKTKKAAQVELMKRRFEDQISDQLGNGEFQLIREVIKKGEAHVGG